jgi:hypothetical protein
MVSINFPDLVDMLRQFRMSCAPSREGEIESALEMFLKSHGVIMQRQVIIRSGRPDIIVGNCIIEIKLVGQKNIAMQLDKYSGYCDGLIVVCWKATDPLKLLFIAEKKTAKIPVELVEVRRACGMI